VGYALVFFQNEIIQPNLSNTQLIRDGTRSPTDFQWLYHMRFRWEEGNDSVPLIKRLTVQMANASFHYGFEYLGVAERLVQTPLTDHCYLTLTQVPTFFFSHEKST